MSSSQQYPQLSFQFFNGSVQNTIYITTDPDANKLVLSITTNTDNTVFNPGKPVPKSDAETVTWSLLYLDLTALNLSEDEFGKLSVSADGWTFGLYSDSRTVCMVPDNKVILNSGVGQTISISMDNLTISNPPSQSNVQLTVTAYRVDNITVGSIGLPVNFQVSLQNPPDTHDKDLHEVIELDVPQYFIVNSIEDYSDVNNSTSIVFKPGPSPKEVLAGDTTSFCVSFVYDDEAPGYGALTTPQAAGNFSFEKGINAGGWQITPPSQGQREPSWLLQPEAGKPIIGSGDQSMVQFDLGEIVTDFQPGPTLMLVSYSDVPGYQDGCFSVTLQKVPHVSIKAFTVTPNPTHLTNEQVKVTLKWEAYDAGTLTIMPLYQDVTGQTSCTAVIRESTTFSLRADGLQLANAGNIAYKNIRSAVLPVVNSFKSEPDAIYYKDFPHNATLSWDVNTDGTVELCSSATGKDSNVYNSAESVIKDIRQPQMFTVSPSKCGSIPTLSRNEIVSAFNIVPRTYPLTGMGTAIAFSPNSAFIAVGTKAGKDENQVLILDTVSYRQICYPVRVGKYPEGIAFSPDGSLMFTANLEDGTVSVVEVVSTGSTPAYRFTVQDTIMVGESPMKIAVSPNGRYVYVTNDNGLQVLKKDANGKFSLYTTVSAGCAPAGLAVSPSGAKIFVANSLSDSVSVIGVSASGEHSLISTINNLASMPFDVAITPKSNILLVACATTWEVYAMDADYPDRSPRQILKVGDCPSCIALDPWGAYAYVVNEVECTVSVISCKESPQQCSVIERSIPANHGPCGCCVSPDGGIAVTCNYTGESVTVLDLAQYEGQTEAKEVGSYPTSVCASPDGSRVLVWNNSLLNAGVPQGSEASAGIFVYETALGTVTQQMQNDKIIDCAFYPRAGMNSAFVIKKDYESIDIINAQTYQRVETIALPQKQGAAVRFPIDIEVSSDGNRLFACACDGNNQYSLIVFGYTVEDGLWNAVSDVTLFTLSSGSAAVLLSVTPDASKAFVTNPADKTLWVVEKGKGGLYNVQQSPVQLSGVPSAITVLPDGSKVYVLNKGGKTDSISIIDTNTLLVDNFYLPGNTGTVSLNYMTVSPDGNKIFATDGVCPGVRVLDAASLKCMESISWADNVRDPYGIAVLPDGSQIFTANFSSSNLGIIRQVQPVS